MNLYEARRTLASLSGRYDLVEDDTTELVDFFINEGSKYLDRITEVQKTWATHFRYMTVADWNVQFPYCRAVKEVWVATTEARWQLEKRDLQWMLANLMTELVTNLDTGNSLYYSPFLTKYIPPVPAGISQYIDRITTEGDRFNAVLILPPPDVQILVEVKGFFHADELLDKDDTNYWSIAHPSLLIMAALREVEVYNQNTSKIKLWNESIKTSTDEINKDLVEEIIAETDQMEG